MRKFKDYDPIVYLLVLSLLIRLAISYFYSDNSLVNEWGIILHNHQLTGIFGYNVAINDYFAEPKFAEINEIVLPTVFMPPLYYYFIYFIKIFTNNTFDLVLVVIFFQTVLSLFSIIIFYKIINFFETKKLAFFVTIIFAIFPINVLATSQISSIILQIFLILSFLFFLLKFIKEKNNSYLYFFSIFSGLLVLIRGEFLIFYFLTLIYFFFFLKKEFKSALISVFIALVVVSPYLHRNFNYFDTITLTKSLGYNLLKGNNPSLKVEGDANFIENNFKRQDLKIKTDSNYEIILDDFYKKKAIQIIIDNPLKYIKFYFTKLLSFLFVDFNSSYPNYYNFFHIIPKILISITSLIGGIYYLKKKSFLQFLSLYYFSNIFLFSVFFILPRYSLILLPVQLILSLKVFRFLSRKLFD
jgi:hypothetical protein